MLLANRTSESCLAPRHFVVLRTQALSLSRQHAAAAACECRIRTNNFRRLSDFIMVYRVYGVLIHIEYTNIYTKEYMVENAVDGVARAGDGG